MYCVSLDRNCFVVALQKIKSSLCGFCVCFITLNNTTLRLHWVTKNQILPGVVVVWCGFFLTLMIPTLDCIGLQKIKSSPVWWCVFFTLNNTTLRLRWVTCFSISVSVLSLDIPNENLQTRHNDYNILNKPANKITWRIFQQKSQYLIGTYWELILKQYQRKKNLNSCWVKVYFINIQTNPSVLKDIATTVLPLIKNVIGHYKLIRP